ncbi:MAG: prepilin-type N-terminal cleavage/methylation domain-containing protein [Nitrospirae bacterium]|nr:prepilin-type N-terminal cleavage/methylation domain-containing protein [Nitrospirota bacterium]
MSPDLFGGQRGLSLIEVVVCMLILAVGMISGLSMTRASQTGLDAGRRISAAAGFAQAKMEEEISVPYDKLSQGGLEDKDNPEGFIRTWTVQNNAPHPRCSTIRVAVEWAGKTGRTHSLALVTIRSKGVVP